MPPEVIDKHNGTSATSNGGVGVAGGEGDGAGWGGDTENEKHG